MVAQTKNNAAGTLNRYLVYICYARTAQDFVRSLDEALHERNIDTWKALNDIAPFASWREAIFSGIEAADAFIFVISPDSVNSEACADELAHAVQSRTPLIPVMYQLVDEESVDLALSTRQWVSFDDSTKFNSSLETLVEAINYSVLQDSRFDSVPTLADHPAQVDKLRRKAFAQALAMRVGRMRSEDDQSSFMLNIHGPWGSGKTSLLNFLSQELKRDLSPWVVVNFNAWRYQRIGPPWWWLITSVFRQGIYQLITIQRNNSVKLLLRDWVRAILLMVREYTWRFLKAGRALYLLALALIFGAIWLIGSTELFGGNPQQENSNWVMAITQAFYGNVEKISGIIAIVTGIWAILLGISRSLLPASAQAAQTFMESTRNPMRALTQHFNLLIDRLGYPVAIFIDDLDRCRSSYVIDLLEGIQTLFRERPVVYIVAADRRWISTCFERGYDDFASQVNEPGRSLGYLFLEKTFQLSIPVPQMSATAQKSYWQDLIGLNPLSNKHELDSKLEVARRTVREVFQDFKTEEQIQRALRQSPKDPVMQQAFREEAALRLETAEVAASTEHALKPFAQLLEPNPRSMKRLVNAYGIRRTTNWLAGGDINPEQLALYTILDLQWPLLGEYLVENPEMISYIGNKSLPDNIPKNLHKLFQEQKVQDVVLGKIVETSLDEHAIRACTDLLVSDS
jgi:hypothetical protein